MLQALEDASLLDLYLRISSTSSLTELGYQTQSNALTPEVWSASTPPWNQKLPKAIQLLALGGFGPMTGIAASPAMPRSSTEHAWEQRRIASTTTPTPSSHEDLNPEAQTRLQVFENS